jgi:beta-glucosidase/6-phospho-beta-glucosidase/beta-galactosidase
VSFVDPAILGGSGMDGYFLWQMVDGISASRTQTKLRTDDGRII